MTQWYSKDNLKRAWEYAKVDIRDDFAFDVINHEDIKLNLDRVLSSLYTQIRDDQYYPAPILRIPVPKNDHSVRPGTVVPLVDLIVLYAIAQQLAPLLDPMLSGSVYAYRLNPKAHTRREPLFKDRSESHSDKDKMGEPDIPGEEEEAAVEAGFPSGWFENWKAFHEASKSASEEHEYAAVTDITAYFENISLNLLREILKEILTSDEIFDLVDRLFRLLERWDWKPSGNLPPGMGLPQGNDVSSFLSNLYLMALDREMEAIALQDSSKYGRYMDDIKLFTSNRDQARRALVKLEEVLRTLNLNVQTAKTQIRPAREIFDNKVEFYLDAMNKNNPDKVARATEFWDTVFDKSQLEHWRRPYSRCLTILRDAGDDRALDTALSLFLSDPSVPLLTKHFTYLREFVRSHSYGAEIVSRLEEDTFTFPYHKALMYRLAAYSRDDTNELKRIALQEAVNEQSHWFCRMAALFCLHTFPLSEAELASIDRLLDAEANPQVARAAFIALCQHSGKKLLGVLDRVSFFNAPHQDYLRRYFFQLHRDPTRGRQRLAEIRRVSVRAPTFIHNLHQLDLLKSNSNTEQRSLFREVVETKTKECENEEWPRLKTRLSQIYDSFILRP